MGTKFILGSHGMKALEILVPGTSALHPHSQNYSFRSSTGKSMNTIREIYIYIERERGPTKHIPTPRTPHGCWDTNEKSQPKYTGLGLNYGGQNMIHLYRVRSYKRSGDPYCNNGDLGEIPI